MNAFVLRPRVARRLVCWTLVLALTGVATSCRQFDRTQLAYGELVRLPDERKTLAEFERLAGANPQLSMLWMQTIYVNPARELLPPEEATQHAQRARGFLPGAIDLALAEADWAARASGIEAAREPLEQALAAGPNSNAQVVLRSRLVETLLELGLPEDAQLEAERLSGSAQSSPQQRAVAWAGVALGFEVLGERAAADRALGRSVEQHPAGLERLAEAMLRRPEQGAGARALRARAADQFPWHPDVQLQRVGDQLAAGELEAAAERLAQLPEVLPKRLNGPRVVLQARVLSLDGQAAAAGQLLLDHLDRQPDELIAIQALLLLFQEHQQPERRAVLLRVYDFLDYDHRAPLPPDLRRGLIQIYEQIRTAEDTDAAASSENDGSESSSDAGESTEG
ncbi:MAG: hypothetical protein DHS20C15_01040 [Planctomycetota bacterium]|nr:MAG: hypothetical protein DHS20C15_01040 [Planctomycetota bacterium]